MENSPRAFSKLPSVGTWAMTPSPRQLEDMQRQQPEVEVSARFPPFELQWSARAEEQGMQSIATTQRSLAARMVVGTLEQASLDMKGTVADIYSSDMGASDMSFGSPSGGEIMSSVY